MNGESLSLFQLEPGQYERSMGIDPAIGGIAPMTTADTTAETRLQAAVKNHSLRVSVDPFGWDQGNCVLFAAEPALCRNKEG